MIWVLAILNCYTKWVLYKVMNEYSKPSGTLRHRAENDIFERVHQFSEISPNNEAFNPVAVLMWVHRKATGHRPGINTAALLNLFMVGAWQYHGMLFRRWFVARSKSYKYNTLMLFWRRCDLDGSLLTMRQAVDSHAGAISTTAISNWPLYWSILMCPEWLSVWDCWILRLH